MSTREITIRVPLTWTRQELEARLRRLNRPEVTEAQADKRAVRLELETAELARVARLAGVLEGRLELVEQALPARPELETVTELVGEQDRARVALEGRAAALEARAAAAEAQAGELRGLLEAQDREHRRGLARVLLVVRQTHRTQAALTRQLEALELEREAEQ